MTQTQGEIIDDTDAKPGMSEDWRSRPILDAVERWATGCHMFREIELIAGEIQAEKSLGRLDAMLVPLRYALIPWRGSMRGWTWTSRRLVGIEVKVDRADLKRGLSTGQFERYLEGVGALYIATPAGLCKTNELPDGVGHLVVRNKWKGIAVCRRRATFGDAQPSVAMMWKILAFMNASHDRIERERMVKFQRAQDKVGKSVSSAMSNLLKRELAGTQGDR